MNNKNETRICELARHYHRPITDIKGFNRLLIEEGIRPVTKKKLSKILGYM
jgi:hypothetical protein